VSLIKEERENGLTRQVSELHAELGVREVSDLARTCGAELVDGRILMKVWDTAVAIDPLDFIARDAESGEELDLLMQGVIAYYLHTSDGTQAANNWIAFTDLPDGRFYTQAFQGYTGRELGQHFGNDVGRFAESAVACGGTAVPFGDAAFRFQALPLVPLLLVCWQGDEDLPPSYKILFDAHTEHHLPTDACAILGSILTRRLLRNLNKSTEAMN